MTRLLLSSGSDRESKVLAKKWLLGHGQEGLRLESWCCAIHYKQPAAQMAESPERHAYQWHSKDKGSQTVDAHYKVWQA